MIKFTRFYITFLLAVIALGAKAQSTSSIATSSSPYSRYGIGDIDQSLLPQNLAMGGISTAINRISLYNNINVQNPASYGMINYTTIDAGIYSNIDHLSQNANGSLVKASNANFRLSHVAFAIPVTRHSALSFGLLPFSEMGYNYRQTVSNLKSNSPADTNAVNYLYSGQGGLSKAYLGYGIGIGKHLLVGANMSYIFGNLQQYSSTEIPNLYGTLNSRTELSSAIRGLNFDLGAQYSFELGDAKHLIFGYSTSLKSNLNSTNTYVVSQYTYDASGNENVAADSLINRSGTKTKIQLPMINRFGVSYQYDTHFLIGADYSIGKWSQFSENGVNAGFQDSKTYNIGGQFTPNPNALKNIFARTDYRLGFMYNSSYLNLNNTTISTTAVTFGIGMPLAPNISTFYKLNFSVEVGKRGTLDNGLVKENYVNLHLSFIVNDRWFQKFKFD